MDSTPFRLFLLSPAHCGGKRAQLLVNGRGRFPLAARLRAGESVTLGETFAFLSGLYFRGKLTYARHFGRAPSGHAAVLVITANNGLVPAEASVYFTHSYAGPVNRATAASTEYGERFAAAVEQDLVMGLQFHPEKSGATGLRILDNFLRRVAALAAPAV